MPSMHPNISATLCCLSSLIIWHCYSAVIVFLLMSAFGRVKW